MKKIFLVLVASMLSLILSNTIGADELYLAQRDRYYHYQQPSDDNEGDIRVEYYPDSQRYDPEGWYYRDEQRRSRTYK